MISIASKINIFSNSRDKKIANFDLEMSNIIERLGSAFALVVLSPLLAFIAGAVKLTSSGKVFYEPMMLGKNAKPFRMKKFRSMVESAPMILTTDDKTVVEKDDPRLTKIGKFLRLGFDELPQLINILRGEMSLVGPRPDPAWVLSRYTSEIKKRLSVRPGITGLSQVLDGRSQRQSVIYAIDVYYAEHKSIVLDVFVIFMTIPYLFGYKGIAKKLLKLFVSDAESDIEQFTLLPPDSKYISVVDKSGKTPPLVCNKKSIYIERA